MCYSHFNRHSHGCRINYYQGSTVRLPLTRKLGVKSVSYVRKHGGSSFAAQVEILTCAAMQKEERRAKMLS
ncbi:hypothetical protein QQP08_011611 [Theobroma cacao]|nr:hypothetical protein QQP08_011611 [Theobroma cacao]